MGSFCFCLLIMHLQSLLLSQSHPLFYVASDGVDANNADCSPNSPCASLTHAVEIAQFPILTNTSDTVEIIINGIRPKTRWGVYLNGDPSLFPPNIWDNSTKAIILNLPFIPQIFYSYITIIFTFNTTLNTFPYSFIQVIPSVDQVIFNNMVYDGATMEELTTIDRVGSNYTPSHLIEDVGSDRIIFNNCTFKNIVITDGAGIASQIYQELTLIIHNSHFQNILYCTDTSNMFNAQILEIHDSYFINISNCQQPYDYVSWIAAEALIVNNTIFKNIDLSLSTLLFMNTFGLITNSDFVDINTGTPLLSFSNYVDSTGFINDWASIKEPVVYVEKSSFYGVHHSILVLLEGIVYMQDIDMIVSTYQYEAIYIFELEFYAQLIITNMNVTYSASNWDNGLHLVHFIGDIESSFYGNLYHGYIYIEQGGINLTLIPVIFNIGYIVKVRMYRILFMNKLKICKNSINFLEQGLR